MSKQSLPFESDYAIQVIRPRVTALLANPPAGSTINSFPTFLTTFNTYYETTISALRMRKWLTLAGITIQSQRSTVISGVAQVPTLSTSSPSALIGANSDDGFDNEQPGDLSPGPRLLDPFGAQAPVLASGA